MPEKPDAIYGALAGGVVVLLTTFLTNRNARKRQIIDLAHQAEQKEKERIQALKRDIYLPLLEAASPAINFVAQLGTVTTEEFRAQKPLVDMSRQVAKLSLVAPPEVMEAVNKSFRFLIQASIQLMPDRWKIEGILAQLAVVETQIQFFATRQKSLQDRQERHVDAGTRSAELVQYFQLAYQQTDELLEKLLADKNRLTREKAQMEVDLGRKAAQALQPLTRLNSEALVAIRNELGLPIDLGWLTNFTDNNMREMMATVGGVQDQVQEMIARDTEPQSPA